MYDLRNEENEDIPEEIDSQSEDEEDDGDEDEDDEDDEDEDDEDDVEDDEVEGAEGSQESSSAGDGGSGGSPTDMDLGDKRMQAWVETEALKLMEKTDTCDCHHCVTQTQAEQLVCSVLFSCMMQCLKLKNESQGVLL